ncbi:MAG: transcriptional repressor [Clostridia bacterium]|nr:transcriptional repressor [Clostridia bacterium]
MTRQRAAVLSVVSRKGCHYTAEEIFTEAKLILPTISRATVYNSLHALERDRLIRRITAEDSSDRYDSSYIPHGHLYCTRCAKITDFELPSFTEHLCAVADGEIDSYELKVRYICKECKKMVETPKM